MTVTQAQRDIRRKLRVLRYAQEIGNISQACRHFGVSRETFYQWKRAYAERGEAALVNCKPCPQNPTIRVAAPIDAEDEARVAEAPGRRHGEPGGGAGTDGVAAAGVDRPSG